MGKNRFNKVDRSCAVLKKGFDDSDFFVKASGGTLMDFVWDLTAELYSLGGSADAERRLQRNVTNLVRQRD